MVRFAHRIYAGKNRGLSPITPVPYYSPITPLFFVIDVIRFAYRKYAGSRCNELIVFEVSLHIINGCLPCAANNVLYAAND